MKNENKVYLNDKNTFWDFLPRYSAFILAVVGFLIAFNVLYLRSTIDARVGSIKEDIAVIKNDIQHLDSQTDRLEGKLDTVLQNQQAALPENRRIAIAPSPSSEPISGGHENGQQSPQPVTVVFDEDTSDENVQSPQPTPEPNLIERLFEAFAGTL